MKKLGVILIIIGITVLFVAVILFTLHPQGVSAKFWFVKFKFHNVSNGIYTGANLIFLGLFLMLLDKGGLDVKKFTIVFFLTTTILKLLRYDFYMSTGYDLGNYSSILFNIHEYGRLWDSLNQVNGFYGHIRPSLFLLSTVLYIWKDPRILLILQGLAISSTIPAIYLLARFYKIDKLTSSYLILLFASNIYVHWVNGFDFHLETFAMPLIPLGIYFLEKEKVYHFLLILILTLSFKEDISLGWISIGLFYFLIKKDQRKAWIIFVPTLVYSLLALILMLKFSNTELMREAHYNGAILSHKKISSLISFFASFGFIPIMFPKGMIAYILPLGEHLFSSRPQNFMLYYQYSAILIPIVFWVMIELFSSRKRLNNVKYFVALGIAFSFLKNPVARYIDISKINISKKLYLDNLIRSLPESAIISAGNHISPHLAMRPHVTQFPRIDDAEYILIDTTWHDFTPISGDSAIKLLKVLKFDYKRIPTKEGILVLKKDSP